MTVKSNKGILTFLGKSPNGVAGVYRAQTEPGMEKAKAV